MFKRRRFKKAWRPVSEQAAAPLKPGPQKEALWKKASRAETAGSLTSFGIAVSRSNLLA